MKFPKAFEQFLDLMSFLSEMLLNLEAEEQEYKVLLLDKAHKLEPYIKKAYPVITEMYSLSPEEGYEIFQGTTKEIPKQSIEEIQIFASKCMSDDFLDEMFSSKEEEKQFLEDELHTLIAILRVYTMNMIANNRHLTSINQLVIDALDGSDQSLFLAIQIDPLVESIPGISERIARAQMLNETPFIEQLNKSRSARREDRRHKNNRLNYFLVMFHRFGILNKLTQPQMAEIFINRLNVYDRDDSSLFKYIGRWKKDLKRLDLRQNNKLERSKT